MTLQEEIYKLSLQSSEVAVSVFNYRNELDLTDKDVIIFCEVMRSIEQNIKTLQEVLKK